MRNERFAQNVSHISWKILWIYFMFRTESRSHGAEFDVLFSEIQRLTHLDTCEGGKEEGILNLKDRATVLCLAT
jgi:hypothetical protein